MSFGLPAEADADNDLSFSPAGSIMKEAELRKILQMLNMEEHPDTVRKRDMKTLLCRLCLCRGFPSEEDSCSGIGCK